MYRYRYFPCRLSCLYYFCSAASLRIQIQPLTYSLNLLNLLYSRASNGDGDGLTRKSKKPRKMKNKRSKVWLYFSLVSTGLSECKMCQAR